MMRKLFNSFQKLRGLLRFFSFKLQSNLQGGKTFIGKNVQINHQVKFQGKGEVHLEDRVTLGYGLAGSSSSPILLQPRDSGSISHIGSDSTIVNGTEIISREKVTIGKKCLIGPRCVIVDSDFHGINPSDRRGGSTSPVTLGEPVWSRYGRNNFKRLNVGNSNCNRVKLCCCEDGGDIIVGNPAKGRVPQW